MKCCKIYSSLQDSGVILLAEKGSINIRCARCKGSTWLRLVIESPLYLELWADCTKHTTVLSK